MSYSTNLQPPQPVPGLKITVQFVISERDGQPHITIRPIVNHRRLLSPVGNRWFMPWEERIQSTITFPPEREELRRYIRDQMLWCNPTGVVQATDDQIILKGIPEVLLHTVENSRSACRKQGSGKELLEVEEIDWADVEMSRDGWGEVFKELVKGRRELVVGETRVRALPREGLDVERKRLVFWSSLV
ncbi:uncharacterized protein B0T23DRAFT_436960 [Neurospora hispaniola]|uniref:Uncharacterized protein n=1 Tax=Neurospora hispaniola TaxID=588809 RepID=A0AAJ0HY90_9PEZI|nr:hypothetical protein B0T23DRAFT_436960 [Neurospora hispaniola]